MLQDWYFKAMFFDKKEDIELAAIAEERKGQPEIEVDINELNNTDLVVHSEVFTVALALFENDSHATAVWLNNPVNGLGGRLPVDLLDTEDGAQAVPEMIGRLEHGVFS
jgi:putative toxin-antitoxin system antitoxin component (TIGR02293 family)